MVSSIRLLGPPELHNPPSPKPSSSSSGPSDPFIDLMVANFNKAKLPVNPPRGFTENGAPTFLATSNPCLDFFFHVVPNTPSQRLTDLLYSAWKHDDLTALKLICHLRGVRGTGKSDKEGFYTAILWLHKHHPKTLACNLKSMVQFGYFKDLPEILYRILEGPDVRKTAKAKHESRKKPKMITSGLGKRRGMRATFGAVSRGNQRGRGMRGTFGAVTRGNQRGFPWNPRGNHSKRLKGIGGERLRGSEKKRATVQKEKAKELRKENERAKARKAIARYSRDPDYRFLYDQVAQVFTDYLVSDMKSLQSGDTGKISLASKWCPSLDTSYDKTTLLCESIARRVFPRESYPEYEGIEDAHYAYRVRDRLRKEILVPLRKVLELPELYMSAKKWNSLPYGRVPSVAMTNYKKHFLRHDEERFNEFLGKVARGEAKIAAGALLPHEIINHLDDGEDDVGEVAELQWKRMVDDMSAKGKLKNCIAVCDVSGSMNGTPMEVCVALGLLLSELNENPWKGHVITFSANPQIHTIQGDDLRSKTEFIKNMDWGQNTDFQKVFDMILEVAIAGSLSKDNMIKKIFVFSDMEFDAARGSHHRYGFYSGSMQGGSWDTNYEVIKKKFVDFGYMIPEIVFWNLRDSKATPVTSDQKGVALLSGFSKNMMTMFLNEEEITVTGPEATMELAISGPEYKDLLVLD